MLLNFNNDMYLEPHQRFSFRSEGKTIATGVVVKCMEPAGPEVMDKRLRRKLLKMEMEKLGFNPYSPHLEAKLKPEYKEKRENPFEQHEEPKK